MRFGPLLLVPALLALGGPTPALAAAKVEVTRFHTPETLARLGSGAVEVVAAPGIDGASLETRVWLDAVARELSAQGFAARGADGAPRVAEVRLTRDAVEGGRSRSPVSVGVGGSVGSGGGYYRHGGGSSVGLGLGLNFSGGPRDRVESELSVTIRDRATGAALWEGRASSRESGKSKDLARTAQHLARALFAGFPGRSGETIEAR
ncbi:MAG: DUF4136 domain-containing protein [Novosphingobium sp.]